MALVDSISKGFAAINVKTNVFVEQNKCKVYISTLQNEIQQMKTQLGDIVYQMGIDDGNYDAGRIGGYVSEIKAKYEEIAAQEERILQLGEEEKKILGTGAVAEGNEGDTDVVFCRQCGTQNSQDANFCRSCGNSLK